MTLPADLWPSDTKAFFGTNYSSSTGNWISDTGTVSDLSQSTSGSRPAEDTSTAPSGRKILNGTGGKFLSSGGQIDTSTLASWSTGKWVEFYILKLNQTQDDDFYRFIDYSDGGAENYHLHFFGNLYWWGAQSGSALVANTVYRVIVVADASTGAGQIYLNGTASGSGTTGITTSMRTNWTGTKSIFAQSNGNEASDNKIGCLGYIQRSTFGSTEIAQLDAAMDEWWTTAPGGGGTVYTLPTSRLVVGFSGPPVGLYKNRILTATSRNFGFSGPGANLLRAKKLVADARAFGFSGPPAALNHGYRLTATAYSFGFSGPPAALNRGRYLAATKQTIGFSGSVATLLSQHTLPATKQTVVFTGLPAALTPGRTLVASSATISVTGNAVNLQRALKLTATQASITFTGRTTGLNHGYYLSAASASLSFTGNVTALKKASILSAATASIAIQANATALNHGFYLAAVKQTVTFTGNDVGLNPGSGNRTLTATKQTITFTGQATSFARALKLTAAQASLTFTGNAAYRLITRPAASASYAFTGNATTFTRALRMTAAQASLTFTGQTTNLQRALRLTATSSALTFGGQPALFLRGYYLGATQAALSFTGRAAALLRAIRLTATMRSLTLSASDTALLYSASFHTLVCTARSFAFVGYDVTLGHIRPHVLRIVWGQKPAARIDFEQRPAARIAYTQTPAARIAYTQTPAARIAWRQDMSSPLNVGDTNRIDFTFYDTDRDDEPADPSSLSAVVVSPSGVRTTYTYGVDSQWQRLDTGRYRLSILCTEAKGWSWTVTAAGNVAGVESSSFNVQRNA